MKCTHCDTVGVIGRDIQMRRNSLVSRVLGMKRYVAECLECAKKHSIDQTSQSQERSYMPEWIRFKRANPICSRKA